MNRKRVEGTWFYLLVVAGWLAYAGLSLMSPTDNARNIYHISLTKILVIQISFIIPILIIWLFAAYGTAWFKHYAKVLYGAPEAAGFRKLADGIYFLLLGLVAQSVIATAKPYVAGTDAVRLNVIAGNYVQVIFPLVAFGLIYVGSRSLLRFAPSKPSLWKRWLMLVPFAVLVGLYGWMTLHNPGRTAVVAPAQYATFYMSDPWIIGTIMVPYVITWLLGGLACLNLYYFSRHSKGIIYRRSLRYVATGLIAVLILSASLQFLVAVSTQLPGLSLNQLLLLVYAIVALMGVGYVFIARGASQLVKIEEV